MPCWAVDDGNGGSMKRALMGVAALWGALLLAVGPVRAQALVSGSDCQAEQAAMRGLGAPDAAVREALLPPGVERADSAADALAVMRDAFKDTLSIAQARGAKEDAATFRLTICAYDAAIARKQGPDPVRSSGGVRGAARATGGAVGQNRGKGGNPDWTYDDADHGKCVSVESVSATGGSGLAYGHYKLVNSCAYPLEMRLCITPDRLDGSDSNYDLHQDGAKCPGMGWGAGTIDANEVQNGREWFEYNRLKWDIQVCRKGWDFVGEGDRYPSDILGGKYGCRRRRPS